MLKRKRMEKDTRSKETQPGHFLKKTPLDAGAKRQPLLDGVTAQ